MSADEQQAHGRLRQLMAARRFDEAAALCNSFFGARRGVRDALDHPVYLKESLRIALAQGDMPSAAAWASQLEPLLSHNDPAVDVLFGRHFAAVGDIAAAVRAWRQVLTRAPDLAEAKQWLAKHGLPPEAPATPAGGGSAAIESPNDDKLAPALAELQLRYVRGDFVGARLLCESVFSAHPDYCDSLGHPVYFKESMRIALTAADMQRAKLMAAQFQAAIPRDDPAVHILMARHFVSAGDDMLARSEWQAVLALEPHSAEAQAGLATLATVPQRQRLAVVTMVYDEPQFLPLWQSYYGRQVGAQNCFVIDHGSDDGSTDALSTGGLIRLPRTDFDERQRLGMVQDFCAGLLRYYECVAYTDVDEFLVPDPSQYSGLLDFCARDDIPEVTTSLGVNLAHDIGSEPNLHGEAPILRQRSWMLAAGSMCKPNVIRRRVAWSPGFHSHDGAVTFHGMLNVHLAYADLAMARRRQAKRRRAVANHPHPQHHHKESDDWVLKVINGWMQLSRMEPTLLPDCDARVAFERRIVESQLGRAGDRYSINLSVMETRLWRVPERFRDCL